MKNKIAFSFIISIIIMTVIIMTLNLLGVGGFIFLQSIFGGNESYSLGLMSLENTSIGPEEYVKNFKQHLKYSGGPYIDSLGKISLERNNSWIQILDENGMEVYSYKKPMEVLEKYRPFDIVDYYKYEKPSNIFANEYEINKEHYTYFIGIPRNLATKKFIIYNNEHLKYVFLGIFLVVILIDIILAGVFGIYFSNKLVGPLDLILDRIEGLAKGHYSLENDESILYSKVHTNLNDLSKQLEENELNRARLEAMKDQWIVNISHDLKTPLSSIEGYSELLIGGYKWSNEEILNYGQIINSKSKYIEELINELNLSSQLKNGDVNLKLEHINSVTYIRDLIIEVLNEEEYNDVEIVFLPEGEEILLDLDRFMFKRAFNNILYNSIYYSEEDLKIIVELFKKEDEVFIEIVDNGIGIEEKDLDNIFNRYYRGTNTRKKGTGLGLAIAKDIVEYHGGSIVVESVVGQYSKFIIRI